jgi:hypothetical protein
MEMHVPHARAALPLVFAVLMALAATPAAAQVIRARATDAGSGAPVAEALVRAETPDGTIAAAAFADQDGVAVLRLREGGTYVVQAERAGYFIAVEPAVAVDPRGEAAAALRMQRRPFTIDTVVVIGRSRDERGRDAFARRRLNGLGVFLDSAYVAQRLPRSRQAADLLFGVPGITVPPALLERHPRSTRGWRCMVLLLDGRPFPLRFADGGGRKLHDSMHPSDVVAVEVYREYDEVPPEFQRHAHQGMYRCGVYLYWTRVRW